MGVPGVYCSAIAKNWSSAVRFAQRQFWATPKSTPGEMARKGFSGGSENLDGDEDDDGRTALRAGGGFQPSTFDFQLWTFYSSTGWPTNRTHNTMATRPASSANPGAIPNPIDGR